MCCKPLTVLSLAFKLIFTVLDVCYLGLQPFEAAAYLMGFRGLRPDAEILSMVNYERDMVSVWGYSLHRGS